MIALSLLVIIISGIAAIPYERSPQSNVNVNHTNSELENLKRIKRSSNEPMTIVGDTDSFELHKDDTGAALVHTWTSPRPQYYYNRFLISSDLGYTSWDELLSNYAAVRFESPISIYLTRNDGEGERYREADYPEPIPLSEINLFNEDITEEYDHNMHPFITMTGYSVMEIPVETPRDRPFNSNKWKKTIFDESIWVGLARINVSVEMVLEGFKKGDELILQLAFKVSYTQHFTISGFSLRVYNFKQLQLM